jgi:hypothetical protein
VAVGRQRRRDRGSEDRAVLDVAGEFGPPPAAVRRSPTTPQGCRRTTDVSPALVDQLLPITPVFAGLVELCALIDEPLQAHERLIARAYSGAAREIVAVLPRGNRRTTLAALIGLHHLLSAQRADVIIGAASVAQARICFERMRGFAEHPALADQLVIRHLELRHEDERGRRGFLQVIPSDGPPSATT